MITVNKITKNEIWIHLKEVACFNEEIGKELYENARAITDESINITINLDGVNSINSKGYNYLFDMVKEADQRLCKVFFSNVHTDMDELIRSLTFTSEG